MQIVIRLPCECCPACCDTGTGSDGLLCCGRTLPPTLHATISASPDCGGIDGQTVTLVLSGGTWSGSVPTTCPGCPTFDIAVVCSQITSEPGGQGAYGGNGCTVGAPPLPAVCPSQTVECDPLELTLYACYSFVDSVSTCCMFNVDVVVVVTE